jgi:trk system potassium uptake protein TrkH
MRKEAKGFTLVLGYLGIFLIFEGIATIFPLLMVVFYPSEWRCWMDFVVPGGGGIILGLILFLTFVAGRPRGHFERNEDSLLLVLLWICAVVIGALPFYFTKIPALNYGDASLDLGMDFSESFFESMSGYSATGLTVLPEKAFLDLRDASSGYLCSHVFLFHRAFMQFVGGIGLVLIVAGAISDRYNLKLYFAEGHNDKLMPNLGKSAKLIFGIYFGYIALGALSLWLSGMTVFDAVCHSTSALATGGFSTRSAGYVAFQNGYAGNGVLPYVNSLAIEIITMVLMLLGATNFVLHTFLLRGKWKQFLKDIEVRFAFWVILIFTLATSLSTMYLYQGSATSHLDFATSLRYSVFNVITSLTTTGYTNFANVSSLGEVAVFGGILLMTIGGGLGSTAGALKQYRCAILAKDFVYSIRYRFASERQVNPNPVYRLGELKEEDAATSDEAHNYTFLYLIVFLLGAMVLAFLPGIDVTKSCYEFASALSGTGVDIIGYVAYKAAYPRAYIGLLWILSFAMFIGRLEILPVYFAWRRLSHRLRHSLRRLIHS